MATEKTSRIVISAPFRLSFPTLMEPKRYENKGDPFYSMQMLFETEALESFKLWNDESGDFEEVDIRKLAAALAKEQWPDINVKEAVAHGGLHWPIKSGDKHADKREAEGKTGNDHYRGAWIINAKSSEKFPPSLYYMDGKVRKQVDRLSDTGRQVSQQKFYGGAWCIAELNVVAHQDKYISFYVNSVKFVKDGERFGGVSAMDRFDGVTGGSADYDPTAGMDDDLDDEIPF